MAQSTLFFHAQATNMILSRLRSPLNSAIGSYVDIVLKG